MVDPHDAWQPNRLKLLPEPRDVVKGRHTDLVEMAKCFDYKHLPPHLQPVSAPFATMFSMMVIDLPDGLQLLMGCQRLIEAKDCFVRSALPTS